MSVVEKAGELLATANLILEKLQTVRVEGVSKLANKFKQEISFLRKCIDTRVINEKHLICSNLTQLEALANELLKREPICLNVLHQKGMIDNVGLPRKICVDLIMHGGSVWVKVIARNKRALTLVSEGHSPFAQKSIIDQAVEYLECSHQNIYYFRPPRVVFFFAKGIEDQLAADLTTIGIYVERLKVDSNDSSPPSRRFVLEHIRPRIEGLNTLQDVNVLNSLGVRKLNLGVTTMIAYVSSLTNGGANKHFESEVLRQHAQWERERPVKLILEELFEGKRLYCCKSAFEDFRHILRTLGGPSERQRGVHLMRRLTVVDDQPNTKLKPSGKIKRRSLAIFGTGQHLRAVTVSANLSFIRSARSKGVEFDVFLHESRALTEEKEL